MHNYKYSVLVITSNKALADEFTDKIVALGYKKWSTGNENHFSTIYLSMGPTDGNKSSYNEIAWFSCTPSVHNYRFNIDNPWEYEAALAISAIRKDDNKPYVGEYIIGNKNSVLGNNKFGKINKVRGQLCNTNDYYSAFYQINFDNSYHRKATPEEIIAYMKEKYKVFELPEKWCIRGPIDSYIELMQYLKEKLGKTDFTGRSVEEWYYHNKVLETGLMGNKIPYSDYTEITYEQWKQWYDSQNKEVNTMEKPANWLVKTKNRKESLEVIEVIEDLIGNTSFIGDNAETYYGIIDEIEKAIGINNKSYITKATIYDTIEEWRKVFKPDTMRKYTIKELQDSKGTIWVKCKNIQEAEKMGEYYFFDKKSNPWLNNSNFPKNKNIYCYVGWEGSWGGGWNENTYDKTIDYNQVIFEDMDKKIVGYKLIKDLPTVNAGALFVYNEKTTVWECNKGSETNYYAYSNTDMINPDWFLPIYEEEKKEVTIRVECDEPFNVIIKKGNNQIYTPEGTIPISTLKNLEKVASNKIGDWKFSINSVNIGCKSNISFGYLDEIIKAWEELNK